MKKSNPNAWVTKSKLQFKTSDTKPKTILESITTLHGVNYFSVFKGKKLILWCLLMVANVLHFITFFSIVKDRFYNDQVVTKIHSDWSVDNIPFPSVSICNLNLVSVNESTTIRNILKKQKIPQKDIESFFQDLFELNDLGPNAVNVANHTEIMDILEKHYYNVNTIMEEVHQKCKNLLVSCEFNGKQKNCMDIFSQIQTIAGYCCNFNYIGVNDDEDPMRIEDEDFEYYMDSDDGNKKTSLIATSQSGSSSGLAVVFNVQPEDYGVWSTVPYGAKIMLSDPNDFPETRVIYRYMTPGESLDIKVEPKIYRCEEDLRSLDPEKRGCWFHDEVSLVYTNRYSYETCNTECKIRSYLHYCHCIPYKYPQESSMEKARICGFSDMKCLHYMKYNWGATKLQCVPECYKECRDKEYSIITDNIPFSSDLVPPYITKGKNISELAALRVYFIKSSCYCYMMSLLIDFNTFVATYGGLISLSFGASIITICELIYLSLATILEFCLKYFKKKFYEARKRYYD